MTVCFCRVLNFMVFFFRVIEGNTVLFDRVDVLMQFESISCLKVEGHVDNMMGILKHKLWREIIFYKDRTS